MNAPRLKGRRGAATQSDKDQLPVEVATIIAGSTVADRGEDDQGNRRIVIVTSMGSFQYSRESASEWLIATFDLDDAQLARALKMLHAHAVHSQRRSSESSAVKKRSAWASWKPLSF